MNIFRLPSNNRPSLQFFSVSKSRFTDTIMPNLRSVIQITEEGLLKSDHVESHPTSIPSFRVDAAIQTKYSDDLRAGTFVNIAGLLKGADSRISISKTQDQNSADSFETVSSLELTANSKISDFICAPPDIMAYEITNENGLKELRYNCPEINGTGFGGMRVMPHRQFETIMTTYSNASREIKKKCEENGEAPLIIVANSGREGAERVNGKYSILSNSQMIWEKAFIADKCAEQLGSFWDPCYVQSFDEIASPYLEKIDSLRVSLENGTMNEEEYRDAIMEASKVTASIMKLNEKKPMILLGYIRDIVECCNIEDGQPFLFGRPINGFVNDRAAFNLSKKEGKLLDHRKFHMMNATFVEGVDKLSFTLARYNFNFSAEAKELPYLAEKRGFTYDLGGLDDLYHFKDRRENSELIDSMTENQRRAHRMVYFRGVTEAEGIDGIMTAVDDFLALDMKPLFKPCGTGQSKGIIGYRKNESRDQFKQRFLANLDYLERLFGKSAGYPFLVMPILKLATTKEGEIFDIRFVIYRKENNSQYTTIHCIPIMLKKSPGEKFRDDENEEFIPTNITRSVEKTGRPSSDFVVPLCRQDTLDIVNLDTNRVKSFCLYLSAFQNWLLKTKYCN